MIDNEKNNWILFILFGLLCNSFAWYNPQSFILDKSGVQLTDYTQLDRFVVFLLATFLAWVLTLMTSQTFFKNPKTIKQND